MHNYYNEELNFLPHRSGQDKQLVTFCKVHNITILKNHASYENWIDIANWIWASDIVDIYGMAPERNIYEETDV